MKLTGTSESVPTISVPGEVMLESLVNELGATLTEEQKARYSTIRGMLATGRDSLLATTSFVVEQRVALDDNIRAIEKFIEQDQRVEHCLGESLRALRSFGSTEAQLARLTRSMAEYNSRVESPKPELPILRRVGDHSVIPTEDFRVEMDEALPPRGRAESADDDNHRRGASTTLRKARMAAMFGSAQPAHVAPTPSAAQFARTAHFEDIGTIPTPLSVGAATAVKGIQGAAGALYESFHEEKAQTICTIFAREIGVTLQLPPHIRSK
ncbi:hypothetical protein MVEN_00038300 [Mycena venus]|uniref:Uncharacterized protein n=1 Tax=Mycena venus TaxID=2733690 RepID=A0A8H7DHQ9_9AGAR|nr:hypothetical protein MVEN_00038300 [Mycena venus]